MNIRYKQLVKMIQLALSLAFLIALPFRSAFSQNTMTMECKSEDFRRTTCSVGESIERIRMIERKSDAACIEGSSFGYSGNSIWVDKGCAATFEVTVRGATQQRVFRRRSQTEVMSLHCRSEQFGRNTCNVDGTVRSVKLQKQQSRASCQEGKTFGYGTDYIWVDKGCDADFEVTFIPNSSRSIFSSRQTKKNIRFTCKSNEFKLGVCYVAGTISDVRLIRKKSRAACTRNDSFGFRKDAVWIKDGCEGEFEVTYQPDGLANWEFNNLNTSQTRSLTCKSDQFRRATCNAGGMISDIRVTNRRSRAECKANSSYGFDFDEVWVKDGCEADFEVIYYPRP